jgi:uncharacterized protein (DUF924 family)
MGNVYEDTPNPQASAVLDYWFGDALTLGWPSKSRSGLWFGGGKAQDEDIARRFGQQVEQALAGALTDWEATPLDRLALLILLDQFTRNVYRGTARAFAGDVRSQALVLDALSQGWDTPLPLPGAIFLYMPLMHAENEALQDECVRRFASLLARAPAERHEDIKGNLKFAEQHQAIIARFGRFPHRNAAMGRANSTEEEAFLHDGPRFGQ